MTNKIKTMEDLRNHAIETLEKLANQDIDTAEAGATGKLCESVISTVKSQYEYARMIGEVPQIPFVEDCHKTRMVKEAQDSQDYYLDDDKNKPLLPFKKEKHR